MPQVEQARRTSNMVQILNAESANPYHGPGMGRVMKRKICVYVSEELVTRLATAAEKRGATKSGLVGSALDRFLDITEDHDTSSSVDDRLARMGDQLDHLARELNVVNETVALHARYHLAVTPPLSDTEQPAACRLGAARFDEFAAQVARRVSGFAYRIGAVSNPRGMLAKAARRAMRTAAVPLIAAAIALGASPAIAQEREQVKVAFEHALPNVEGRGWLL